MERQSPGAEGQRDADWIELALPIGHFVQRRSVDLAKIVTHVAFVVPAAGYNAALAQGFFAATPAPFPLSLARDVEEGLRQLGRSEAAEEARALRRAREEVEHVPSVLRSLRVQLNIESSKSIGETARALHVSVRTLQRELANLGTSYSTEVQAARMRRAERLLGETDDTLTRISLEVGCSSPQHFSSLFRRLRGVSPSEWRRRARSTRRPEG